MYDLVQNEANHLTTTSSLSSCGYFTQSKYSCEKAMKSWGWSGGEGMKEKNGGKKGITKMFAFQSEQ